MADRIRWGVLGNATIARKCVMPAIANSRNGRLHVLGTRRPDQAVAQAQQLGISKVVDQYETVIDDPDVDAVYIPLPNHLHHPWTLKALAAGKHVLCEKPLACNARQAREMAAAAAGSRRLLMEALMYRFHPRSLKVKQMVDAGQIGTPCLVRVAFTFAMNPEVLAAGSNARLQPKSGGGALLDVGCYGVSAASWLLGAPPRTVQGLAVRNAGGVDTLFIGSMAFGSGALATIEAGFVAALQQTFAVVGDKGSIELPHNAFIPWEEPAFFTVRGREEETGTQHRVDGVDEYRLMVEHFGDAAAGIDDAVVSLPESIQNMRVLDALAKSARSGGPVAP